MSQRSRHPLRVIESRRLTLVAATAELLDADLEGPQPLAEALSAQLADDWPPALFDMPTMRMARRQLADPGENGWSVWYVLTRKHEPPKAIGICSFKGKPDGAGSVEISYSVVPSYRVQGYATEAVARLVTWAFSHQHVVEVAAETLPHLRRSIRVMEKNGFVYQGAGSEYGVVRYVVQKARLR